MVSLRKLPPGADEPQEFEALTLIEILSVPPGDVVASVYQRSSSVSARQSCNHLQTFWSRVCKVLHTFAFSMAEAAEINEFGSETGKIA
jgi:hypothetical protein